MVLEPYVVFSAGSLRDSGAECDDDNDGGDVMAAAHAFVRRMATPLLSSSAAPPQCQQQARRGLVVLDGCSNIRVIGCMFIVEAGAFGIVLRNCTNVSIEGCTFHGSGSGISVEDAGGGASCTGITVTDCRMMGLVSFTGMCCKQVLVSVHGEDGWWGAGGGSAAASSSQQQQRLLRHPKSTSVTISDCYFCIGMAHAYAAVCDTTDDAASMHVACFIHAFGSCSINVVRSTIVGNVGYVGDGNSHSEICFDRCVCVHARACRRVHP